MAYGERQPLLSVPDSSSDDVPSDALPTTGQRKHLTWISAYILVVSRVIGSGIFATPGTIVKSAGSVGLSLLIWAVGTVLAACALAVSMEYGCMLPQSGGEKVVPLSFKSAKLSLSRYTWSIPIRVLGSLRRP